MKDLNQEFEQFIAFKDPDIVDGFAKDKIKAFIREREEEIRKEYERELEIADERWKRAERELSRLTD